MNLSEVLSNLKPGEKAYQDSHSIHILSSGVIHFYDCTLDKSFFVNPDKWEIVEEKKALTWSEIEGAYWSFATNNRGLDPTDFMEKFKEKLGF